MDKYDFDLYMALKRRNGHRDDLERLASAVDCVATINRHVRYNIVVAEDAGRLLVIQELLVPAPRARNIVQRFIEW